MKYFLLLVSIFSFSTFTVFSQEENSELTHGNVQMTLKVNETSQFEVLETFGAPNITTIDATKQEVWVYRKHATVSRVKNSSGGFSIGILGGSGGVGAGAGFGTSRSKADAEQSYRSMTLIIKFGPDGLVSDFKSRSSSF